MDTHELTDGGIWIDATAKFWVVNTDKTQDHWLEVKDPEGYWEAVAKFDGCVDLRRGYHGPDGAWDDEDYIHICDLDDYIKRLQALQSAAKRHHGEDWR